MTMSFKAIRPSRFKIIDPDRTRAELRKAMEVYLKDVRDQLREGYEIPLSKRYPKRSRNLYRGFKIRVSRNGAYGTLTNEAKDEKRGGRPYAVYVIGPRYGRGKGSRQSARMRKRGWKSVSDVVRATAKNYQQIMNRAIFPRKTVIEPSVEV